MTSLTNRYDQVHHRHDVWLIGWFVERILVRFGRFSERTKIQLFAVLKRTFSFDWTRICRAGRTAAAAFD